MQDLINFIGSVQTVLVDVGLTLFVSCVVVAGIMRMISLGHERRMAMANVALWSAIIGLVVMLLAIALKGFIVSAFPNPPK